MEQIESGGPAFPAGAYDERAGVLEWQDGMTLRQYAAIKLRVPDSGEQWLDDMIRKAQRDELAARALMGMLACYRDPIAPAPHLRALLDKQAVAQEAYQWADAMQVESEGLV